MKYSDFLSWITDEKQRESPYQLLVLVSPSYSFNSFANIDIKKSEEKSEVEIFVNEGDLQDKYFNKLIRLIPSDCLDFLQYHFDVYKGNKINFIWFTENSFIEPLEDSDSYGGDDRRRLVNDPKKKIIDEWIANKQLELKAEEPKQQFEKIKWKGTPAIFTFLFRELVDKGYIEPPIYGTEWTYSGFAKQCLEHFEIDVDHEYFARSMRNPEGLVNTKKNKFRIPNLSELA